MLYSRIHIETETDLRTQRRDGYCEKAVSFGVRRDQLRCGGHRGVGTGSCGPDTFDAYRTLDSGIYEFDFRVTMG